MQFRSKLKQWKTLLEGKSSGLTGWYLVSQVSLRDFSGSQQQPQNHHLLDIVSPTCVYSASAQSWEKNIDYLTGRAGTATNKTLDPVFLQNLLTRVFIFAPVNVPIDGDNGPFTLEPNHLSR